MQALSSLFRTPTRLRTPTTVSRRNKRTRGRTSSLSSTPSTPSTPSLPAVVLQTYSLSTDSIVLTALPSVPFCCHEDLLTMSRAQLESVVRALNMRLPRRMQIGPEDEFWQNNDQDLTRECDGDDDGLSRMSEVEMKKRIEELVGIRAVVGKNRVSRLGLGLGTRTGVPPAPKAMRTRDSKWRPYEKTPWEMEVDAAEDQTDDLSIMIEDALTGSSPLASRTKSGSHSRGRNGAVSRLAILQEVNEGGESKEDDSEDNELRPSKRQRVSLGRITQQSEEGARESRLIENMDLSGSPLLAGEDDASSVNFTESDERAVTTIIPDDRVQAPILRRRSARIQGISLKQASSVDTGKTTTLDTRDLKSSLLRSKSLSSRRLSKGNSTMTGGSDAERDSGIREFTIRLPFTSTPPHQKFDSSAWSAPRVLRSHSQRLLKSSQSATMKASLGRSRSERYPRATDMTFVTIDRPRYRFTRRKSKGSKVSKEFHPSMSTSPPYAACQPEQGTQIGMEDSSGMHEYEKENELPKIVTRNPAMGGLHALPSALCSFLAPRSKALSTSTVASTRGNGGDSPARTILEEVTAPTAITNSVVGDGAAERVWEALGRMVVDSL
ncbi:hypothetical protein J3R82DRAFT_1558 [Butyriboletus roseoflavus]|nr:hypothetical protein J3R82DRAFT_1558 [Butyriboletus roseoflavus]